MFDLLLLLLNVSFIAAGVVVGGKLLRIAIRARQPADMLISLALVVLACVAYPVMLAGAMLELSLPGARALIGVLCALMVVGFGCVYAFTLRVFRPREAWALALAAAGIALLVFGWIASLRFSAAAPDLVTLRGPNNPMIWINVSASIVYLWTGAEGFVHWSRARRQLALGLTEPLAANRFLCWGMLGVCGTLAMVPVFAISVVGGDPFGAVGRLSTSLGGFGCAVSLQLAFLPPAAYRRWIAARAPS